MKKKTFENGVTGERVQQREYELSATLKGVRAEPSSILLDREVELSYEELRDDASITNEEELLEKINNLILKENGVKSQILLSYDFQKDRGNNRLKAILKNNHLLKAQFDSE